MYLSWGSCWNIWSLTIREEIKTQASGKMPRLMGEGEAVGPPCGGSGGLPGLESSKERTKPADHLMCLITPREEFWLWPSLGMIL